MDQVDANDPSQEPAAAPPEPRWEDGDASFPSGLAFCAPGPRCAGMGPLFMGKYRLLAQLGRGGMGVVYAAEHTHSGATVAIKMLPGKDPALGDRLLRESRALARLADPRIVMLFDSGITDEGDYYIVMELVPGVNLRTLMQKAIKTCRRLPLRLTLAVMLQMTEATASAHDVGIVHRDIKPENVMVAKLGRAKLVDFGLAKDARTVAPADALGAASDPAHVPGTPRYMAPEQVNGGEIDGRTDVYSIGVVLYELVCGCTPYGDDPTTATAVAMGHHLFATPRPIHELAPDCPDDVRVIILRCLEKDPARRYASADDLARDLRAALDRCVAATRATRARGRVVRVTEPPSEVPDMRPVLPFVAPAAVAAVAPAVVAVAVPPEDEEVTLTRGTMLPGLMVAALPVVAAPAPPVVVTPALQAVQMAPAVQMPPVVQVLPAVQAPQATRTLPAMSAPALPAASAPPAVAAASGSTANGVTVESATPPAPRPVKPPAAAAPVARGTWIMKLPPYSVAAVGGVVVALALSVAFVAVKTGDARGPVASTPVALSPSTAPAAPPPETAAPAPSAAETAAETAAPPAPARPPTKIAAPAPPPPATAAPASPPPAPLAVRTAAPAPAASASQPHRVKPPPPEPLAGRILFDDTEPFTKPAPPASVAPPPPAPTQAPHRLFGTEP